MTKEEKVVEVRKGVDTTSLTIWLVSRIEWLVEKNPEANLSELVDIVDGDIRSLCRHLSPNEGFNR